MSSVTRAGARLIAEEFRELCLGLESFRHAVAKLRAALLEEYDL